MDTLTLSIMQRGDAPADDLMPFLDQFGAQHDCRVRVNVLKWETAWSELVKYGLQGFGPDVSEVGMNWVANLLAMQALRPYERPELQALGGSTAFLDSSWRSGWLIDDRDQLCWAVPWLADTRVIYYRRDWLREAGIDERTAFQSHQQFVQTLDRLRANGRDTPLALPTTYTLETLHNAASWVWAAGGDFISLKPLRTVFNETHARTGLAAYLSLYRYLPPGPLDTRQSNLLHLEGQAAVTLSGTWLWLLNEGRFSDVLAHTGVALPPGMPFTGGSNLVVWKHTQHERTAIELVRFLTSLPVQEQYCRRAGLLPVRAHVLSAPPFIDDPAYSVMAEGVKFGRPFPPFSAWGLIEDRLTTELTQMCVRVQADSDFDLQAALAERLSALASQLDATLAETVVPFWV